MLVHINILSILLNIKAELEAYEGAICRLRINIALVSKSKVAEYWPYSSAARVLLENFF